ncbi:hypothetical protein [Halalkalibacter alkaliphilus]|uniref:Uncharacterized protein n=1 Tax=Halalkalibacter alkaliphilus TaxID=2917993 RepID=A0A9X2CTV2_9BACI|nr:hypothetical protein [Halalkalibacter alkaliphilus]MCL7748099.1 hypothetical protein [Halalkalibacter alkaliphilus]
MNISIDLLPDRSRAIEGSFPVIPVAGLAAIFVGAIVLTYTFIDTRNQVQALEEQIALQTQVRNTIELEYSSMTTGVTEYNYVDHYTAIDRFLNDVYKGTVDIKDRIYFLLPHGATVDYYMYTNNGDLQLTVTTFSKGDSAVFLNRLFGEEIVSGAELDSITVIGEDSNLAYTSQFTISLQTLVGEVNE